MGYSLAMERAYFTVFFRFALLPQFPCLISSSDSMAISVILAKPPMVFIPGKYSCIISDGVERGLPVPGL